MPAIPLGVRAYLRQANFQPEVECVNVYLEQDLSGASPDKFARIMRPGLGYRDRFGTGEVRGLFRQPNFLDSSVFRVSGDRLYKDLSPIGSIAGADRVAWAPSISYLFILGGGVLYYTNGTTLGVVGIPNASYPVDIDTLNSYVIVSCADGTIFWVVPGENSIDALNFVTAESSPDGLIAGRRLESEIFFAGQSSIEPWQLTGDPDAPIQKAIGRQYERGIKARDTLRRFDNSLVWVGENNIVYRAGAQPEAICDEGLAERIRRASGELSACTFFVDRHEFYVLRIPGQGSFAYDASTREWCRFQSHLSLEWAPQVAISDTIGVIFGSAVDTRTWDMLPESAADEETPIKWSVSGNVAMLGRPQRNDSMSIGIGCASDCTVRVRWHDARDSYPAYYEELQARAPADMVNLYRMGSIEPPFRSFEVSGNDGVRVRISGAATEAWD